MIKLMGNKPGHLPVQLAGGGASGSGTNVKATFVKTSSDQVSPYLCAHPWERERDIVILYWEQMVIRLWDPLLDTKDKEGSLS